MPSRSAPASPRWAVPVREAWARSGPACCTSCWRASPAPGGVLGKDSDVRTQRYGFLEKPISACPTIRCARIRRGRGCVLHRHRDDRAGDQASAAALLKELAERNAARTNATPRIAGTLAATRMTAFALTYLDDELQAARRRQNCGHEAELVRSSLSSSGADLRGTAVVSLNPRRPWTNSTARFSARRRPGGHRPRERPRLKRSARRWRSSIGRRRCSSATSVTSSARR